MDSKDFVSTSFFLLKFSGLRNKNHLDKTINYTLTITPFAIVNILNLLALQIGYIYYLCNTNTYNTTFFEILNICLGLSYLTLVAGKAAILLLKRQKLLNIMQELDEIFPRTRARQREMQADDHLRDNRYYTVLFATLQITAIWIFNLAPLFDAMIKKFIWPRNGVWSVRLPYTNLPFFPFNVIQPTFYTVHYMLQCITSLNNSNIILSMDLFLIGLVSQICMHFDRLSEKLAESKTLSGKEGRCFIANIVKIHNMLNGWVEQQVRIELYLWVEAMFVALMVKMHWPLLDLLSVTLSVMSDIIDLLTTQC